MGYLKTVDGVYITETELNTALDFYNTTAEVADYATTYYEQKADLDTDVSALGFLKTINGVYITESELAAAHYTKTEIDTNIYTKTQSDTTF